MFTYPKECWHSCPVQKHHKYHANKLHYRRNYTRRTAYQATYQAYQFELPSMKTYYDVTRGRLYTEVVCQKIQHVPLVMLVTFFQKNIS